MAHLLAQHTFEGNSGKPEDRYVNTFHVRAPDVYTTTELNMISDAVANIYTGTVSTVGISISQYMCSHMDSVGHTVKIYDWAHLKPRAPVYAETYTFAGPYGGTSPNLPQEVACCLSYAGAPTSGVAVARNRGRIYIGPLNTSAVETSGSPPGISTPDGTFRQALVGAADDFQTTLQANDCQWSVYSTVLNSLNTITRVWADNAWDIQRRRGIDPSSRVSLTF